MVAPNQQADTRSQSMIVNCLGWLSFGGLFAIGVAGLLRGLEMAKEQGFAGALYLLIGGLAFTGVLALATRRV